MNETQKDYLSRLFDIASAIMDEDYGKAYKLATLLSVDLGEEPDEFVDLHDCQQCNCEGEL